MQTDINSNKRMLADDPQYFGGYLNMARHNIFLINNHIADKFNINRLTNEDKISGDDCYIVRESKENINYRYSFLTRFMPIAKTFDTDQLPKIEFNNLSANEKIGLNYQELVLQLKVSFKYLNKFRNDYSHYYSTKTKTNRIINLDKNLSVFLRKSYLRAIEYSKKRFVGVFSEEDYKLASGLTIVESDNKITEKGLVFFTCMFLDRENAFQFINKIIGFKGTHTKEFKATREVFSAFCVKLPHNRFMSDNPTEAFVLDMLNELNRCPADLFNVLTEKDKVAFLPKFENNDEKKLNIEKNSIPENLAIEDYEDYIQNISKRIRYKPRFSYFALKFLDKTTFTDTVLFQINLGKFQTNAYDKEFNGKQEKRSIIENVKAFGRLNDFSIPDDIDFKNETNIELIRKEAQEYVETKINKPRYEKATFEQFAPHYNLEQNKIAFQLSPSGKHMQMYSVLKKTANNESKSEYHLKHKAPTAFISEHELKKIVLLEIIDKGKAVQLITKFIEKNKNHLFDKEFIDNIKSKLSFNDEFQRKFDNKKYVAYTEGKLKHLHYRKSELNKLLKEHGLDIKQIPARIIDYCIDIKDVKEESAIANRIKAMKADCKDRLKTVEKGKAPKTGQMATFLARDIVDMVIDESTDLGAKTTKRKITSFYYDKMQECLALYADDEKQKTFNAICIELNLFNKEKGHPFLADLNINEIKNTYEFYKKYLIEKGHKYLQKTGRSGKPYEIDISWMRKTFYKEVKVWNEKKKKNEFKTVIAIPQDLSHVPFSIRNLEKEKKSFNKWLIEKRTKPIDLPINLFDNELKKTLQKKLSELGIAYNEKDTYFYLLKRWFTEDNLQAFYNYERAYTVYDEKINFKLGTKPHIKDYFIDKLNSITNNENKRRKSQNKKELQKAQVLDILNKSITENEKAIRFTHETDRILLLMIKEIVQSENFNLTLKEIDIALGQEIEIEETVKGTLSYDTYGAKIIDNNLKPSIERTITATRKRKDFSILKKLKTDRRLPELFNYFEEVKIPYDRIKLELDSYTKAKQLVFDAAFNLEKLLIDKAEEDICTLHKNMDDIPNIQHAAYLEWLKNKEYINTDEFDLLKTVRNVFSHNQFPPKGILNKLANLKIDDNKPIAEQIYEKYNEKIGAILSKIR